MANKEFEERAKKFKEYFKGKELLLRPCAYDALSAILIERAGFKVVGTTGYGISASLIGQPDIGLVDFSAMLERVRTIVNAVHIPVDVDADTGYGNALNVYWTVKNFARVGAAGIRIEDQVWPKRCGHMAGKMVISIEEMVGKIKGAIKARDEENPYMVIGARTDARSIEGFEGALKRVKAYADAGADYVYVEAPQSLDELGKFVEEAHIPIAFNIIPGGRTPPFPLDDIEKVGVRYLSVPMICLYPATKAMMESLEALKRKDLDKVAELGVRWYEFNEIVGMEEWRRLELETLSEKELLEKYKTTNIDEIVEGEKKETERKWKK
uniref:Isocitrate lyase/PEP mutase family protein n=1 Tax=Caldisericum exile TaxID=693075 RepID=A0A7C4XTZ1_9BACT